MCVNFRTFTLPVKKKKKKKDVPAYFTPKNGLKYVRNVLLGSSG